MKLGRPGLWIGLASAAAVLYVVIGHLGRKSPGEITAVHARVGDLNRGESCSACHGGLFLSMSDACLECHKTIDAQIAAGNGLHGVIGNKAMLCALCHSEHHGAGFAIVNRQSFAAAGVPDPAEFDHNMIRFPMDGRHIELACNECHLQVNIEILPEGATRYIGLDQECTTCHGDVHEGRYAALSCVQCHGQRAWAELESRGHEDYLQLIGGHSNMECRSCHANEPYTLEALGENRAPAARMCVDCHANSHAEGFVDGVALQVSRPTGAACDVCHRAEHTTWNDRQLGEMTVEQHESSGFSLTDPHHEVGCADCHDLNHEDFKARYPARAADDCAACHEDPHGGQFGEGSFKSGACVACHGTLYFEPHIFSVEMHAETSLPLIGSHIETDCNACHEAAPIEGSPRVFHGTPVKCAGCHPDAHEGFFEQFAPETSASTYGRCADCHLATDFRDIPPEAFDHGPWTGFPLVAAHAQEECEACHPRTPEPDRFGRTFGRVSDRFGVYEGCDTCHIDPHKNDFDKPGMPRTFKGKTGCERCHGESSFRTFPNGFDHKRWTGFALVGQHKKVDCADCHTPLREPDEAGRTWARAKGGHCSDCHQDSHAGQFEVKGLTDCRRCHRPAAAAFTDLSFRHDLDSGFQLGEAHTPLACSACHLPVRENGKDFIRYRPMGGRCADCHGEDENPFRRGAKEEKR